jgi:Dynein, heavy chain
MSMIERRRPFQFNRTVKSAFLTSLFPGVGKTVVARSILNKLLASNTWAALTINFSAQTSSARTQEILEGKLDKRTKTLLGAPLGKRLAVFVDDVNMPKLETYGAQPPIELLR